jgi:hypothetical protein
MGDWAFWIWTVAGAGLALSAFSLGPLLGPPIVLLIVLLAWQPRTRSSAWGILVGFGALLLFIAYLNRDEPGDTHLDARPWLVAGTIILATGLIGEAWRSGRSSAP